MAFGGRITRARTIMHGKVSEMTEVSDIYRALQANGVEYEEITTEILEVVGGAEAQK